MSRENNPNPSLVKHLEGGFERFSPTLVAIQMGVKRAIHILDPRLNDRCRAMGTWLEGPDKDRVSSQRLLGRQDGIHLSMDCVEKLNLSVGNPMVVVFNPSRESIKPYRSYGSVWSDNDRANLR
jgi:hypothetical protein